MISLVKKMSTLGILKLEMFAGTIVMAASLLLLPLGIFLQAPSLITNPYVLGVVLFGMLFFGLIGFFAFVRPYLLYRKLPAVQVEADGEFLYIHSKKEAKIPLAEISEAYVHVDLPYLMQKELVRVFLAHLLTEEYGNLVLEIPGYGTYKLYFVAYVQNTSNQLLSFLQDAIDRA